MTNLPVTVDFTWKVATALAPPAFNSTSNRPEQKSIRELRYLLGPMYDSVIDAIETMADFSDGVKLPLISAFLFIPGDRVCPDIHARVGLKAEDSLAYL